MHAPVRDIRAWLLLSRLLTLQTQADASSAALRLATSNLGVCLLSSSLLAFGFALALLGFLAIFFHFSIAIIVLLRGRRFAAITDSETAGFLARRFVRFRARNVEATAQAQRASRDDSHFFPESDSRAHWVLDHSHATERLAFRRNVDGRNCTDHARVSGKRLPRDLCQPISSAPSSFAFLFASSALATVM